MKMNRFKLITVLGVLVGALVLSATVAYAGWWWNSKIDVEGVEFRTVWTVVDDEEGANDYRARIMVTLPVGAEAAVKEQADTEKVFILRNGRLDCRDNGVESLVTYQVQSNRRHAPGATVKATLIADGDVIAEQYGKVGQNINLKALIPASHPDCTD